MTMKLTKQNFLDLNPCRNGLEFAESIQFDAVKGWNTCQRGDWLIWWLRKVGLIDKVQAVRLAIACAERVLVFYEKKRPGDLRPRQAIEVANTWVKNPTEKNRQAAADAAAADASYASADAAAASADAAATASAAASAAAYAAAYTGGKKERQWQADKIREIIPCPFEI